MDWFGFASVPTGRRAKALAVGLAVGVMAGLPGVLAAQTQAPEAPRAAPSMIAPLLPQPTTNASRNESVFVAPPSVEDEPETDWRRANDEAARLGGHVGQLRGRPAQPRP